MAAEPRAAVGRSPEPSTTTPLTRETVSGQNPPAPDGDSCACGTPLIVCECGDGRCPKCDPGDKCPESNKARQRRTAGPNALLKLREFAASPGKGGGMTVNREAARWLVKRLRDVDPSVAPVRSRAVGASDACNASGVGNELETGATTSRSARPEGALPHLVSPPGTPTTAGSEPRTEREDSRVEARYLVDPAARIRELLFVDEIPDTAELTYSFSQGYERLDYRASEQSGSSHFAGVYHPGEGYCVGGGICTYCGRTLFDE